MRFIEAEFAEVVQMILDSHFLILGHVRFATTWLIRCCSFITCDKCLSHSCYACCVPRDVEMGRNIHRCFCRAPHTVPTKGMTDTWLNDDGTRSVFYDLPLRVSDDPNNVIWSDILFHWSKYLAVFPWAFCLKGSSTVVVRSMIFVARSSTL